MRWGLQGRIIAPVMLVAGLAVALSAFLNYGKFLRTFNEIEASRFAFVAGDIKSVIEGGLDLGVSLPGMITAQPVIQDEAERDPQIAGIAVFNDSGQILFKTGEVPGDTAVPTAWLGPLFGREANWTTGENDRSVAVVPLSNDIRQTVGGVAVVYSRATREALLRRMVERLTLGAVVSSLVTALIAFVGVSWLVRRMRREIARSEAAFDAAADDATSSFAEARRTTDAALHDIAAASAELERVRGTASP